MSNQYIEVVRRWLADNDSVSLEELKANYEAASDDCNEIDELEEASQAWHAASAAYTAADAHTTIYPWADPDTAYARYADEAAAHVKYHEEDTGRSDPDRELVLRGRDYATLPIEHRST